MIKDWVSIWRIRIASSSCEWEFRLQGGEDYSIQDLIDIITVHTRMKSFEEPLLVWNEESKFRKRYRESPCGADSYMEYLEGRLESALKELGRD